MARPAGRMAMANSALAAPAMNEVAMDAMAMDAVILPPSVDDLQPLAQTRKVFPETWLWRSNTMK